eukprot:GEMP01022246.1.p1 GENE.GEMP01022246.1~~GEMP01022246.1.p1  ORF type:complete len:654 (-),score=121.62 GEMP01022246.1:290-2251(-)
MSCRYPFCDGPTRKNWERSISRTACEVAYPMYCVPLSVVLEMRSVENHEVLRDRGVLVEYTMHDENPVIFISHQWVANGHPDPEATQLAVFQGAIRRLAAGYEVRSDILYSRALMKDEVRDNWSALLQDALVWYDYFSVPQEESNKEDTQLAIRSIPAYIEMATVMFILAPTMEHRESIDANGERRLCDYYSWAKRGWCRLELFAMYLKVNARTPVVIQSEGSMLFISPASFACQSRTAEGDFTCCRLTHQRALDDGKASSFACDKPVLFEVLRSLITRRINYELTKDNLRLVRQLQAFTHIWLRDLRDVEEDYNGHADTLESFMTYYAFTSPHEFDGGWTPLRFACISGNVNVARQLLDEKADPEANLVQRGGTDFPIDKGTSILLHTIQICCCSEHEDILHLLVAHHADLRPSGQMDALTAASFSLSPFKRGARWLLRKFPDWNVNRMCAGEDGYGSPRWPIFTALGTSADLDFLRLLVAHRADLTLQTSLTASDAFTLVCSVCPTSSPDILEYIYREIQQGPEEDINAHNVALTSIRSVHVDVNRRLGMATPWWTRIALKTMWAINFGPGAAVEMMLRSMGSTALLLAASEGNHRICQWLLDHNADASIPNINGETALSFAKKRGFTRVVDVLCSAEEKRVREAQIKSVP